MHKENIKVIFQNYLLPKQTQYALLINGRWGSGKTFFWKTELQPLVEASKLKPIYISLNGISKIEQLEHIIFMRLLPFLRTNNKTTKSIISLVTNAANIFSQYVLKAGLADIFKGLSIDALDLSKYLIALDDLERCQIPIKEILGYINNYIEHKSVRILILADETNIDVGQKGYDLIKEKAIGRVLNFELDESDVVNTLIKNYNDDNPFTDFLLGEKDLITGILQEYELSNLRIIGFFLDTLKVVILNLDSQEKDIIREVILFTALISFEFKSGVLTSADSNDHKGLPNVAKVYYSNLVKNEIKKSVRSVPETYADQFCERYLLNRISEFYFYPSIYSYVLSGYFDDEKFKKEIKARKPEESEEQKALNGLIKHSFRVLENDVFVSLVTKVRDYAQQGKYSIYDYAFIANFFFFFSKKCLVQLSKEEVKSFLHEGLNTARNKKAIDENALDNLMHFDSENPDTEEIKQFIKQLHTEIQKEQLFERSKALIDAIQGNNIEELRQLFERYEFDYTLLAFVDENALYDAIKEAKNATVYELNKLIVKRYRSDNIGEFLAEEMPTLKTLEEKLENLIKQNPLGQPKALVINELLISLSKQYRHLNNTQRE